MIEGGQTLVEIRLAETKKDLVRFMEFPLELYRDNPYYVPDMLSSQVADMQRDKNPAFEYCDARCYLAFRNGKIVGRVAGILNERANEKFRKKYLIFSSLDFIDDGEVVDALFDAVEGWARELGCEAVHGPLGFSDMDREGMLIEGFDKKSLFYTYYNYPYYIKHMERRGYGKEIDWVECRITLPAAPDPGLVEIAEHIRQKKNLRVINLNDQPIKKTARDMFELYNNTYCALFGMVPLTERQIVKYIGEFRPMVDERTTSFVYDDNGSLVAFGICCPSLDSAQQKSRGRMLPFGWFHMLRALKGKNDTVDLLLISVRPELQGQGVNAIVMVDMLKKVLKAGFKFAETGPMLETNTKVLSQWRHFDTEQHKRRRCWVKEL